MKSDLLLKLAERLEQPMPEHFTFDMCNWLVPNEYDSGCGTAGCAIGLACSQMPEFATLELRLGGLPVLYGLNRLTQFDAIAAFLEISREDAYYLFSITHYRPHFDDDPISPREVASRIREFITRETLAAEHRARPRV
jgi:hypothetical protein